MSLGLIPAQIFCLFPPPGVFFNRFFLATISTTVIVSGCSALQLFDLNEQ